MKAQSGFGHNATFNVQPREIKGPLGNQAAKLDGISWAEIEDSDDLDLMTALTIEAWVFISSDEKQIVVEKGATWKRDGEYSLLFYEKRRPLRNLPSRLRKRATSHVDDKEIQRAK